MPSLRQFNRDFELGGRSVDGFTEDIAARLARSLSALARRRGATTGPMVFAREDARACEIRDGLVQGWLLGGEDVVDVGRCSAGAHEGSLIGYAARGGCFLAVEDDVITVSVFVGSSPLTGAALQELFAVSDDGCFPAGEGSLSIKVPLDANNTSHITLVDG